MHLVFFYLSISIISPLKHDFRIPSMSCEIVAKRPETIVGHLILLVKKVVLRRLQQNKQVNNVT